MKDKEILYKHAAAVRQHAYAPYSKFLVGSCIETENGNIYTGCNVENAAYPVSACAETNAIAAMIAAGEYHIKQIMVVVKGPRVSFPCGACRQRIYEFATKDTIVHLQDLYGAYETYRMSELLPHAFGPEDLREKTV